MNEWHTTCMKHFGPTVQFNALRRIKTTVLLGQRGVLMPADPEYFEKSV